MKIEEINANAKALLATLRNERQFGLLADMAAAYLANAPYDPEVVTWQAQGLIESGNLSKARTLLADVMGKTAKTSKDYSEAQGLTGRAWKQAFFDARKEVREAIDNSMLAYKACLDLRPDRLDWAGVNLLALAHFADREKIPVAVKIDSRALALKVLATLDATPTDNRDNWYHASRAEAYLAMNDLDNVELHIGAYVRDAKTTAFSLGGTLRQFTDLWQLDKQGPQGYGIVQALRTALMRDKEYGRLEMSPEQVRTALAADAPPADQLEKILGDDGPTDYDWMMRGMRTARAVGVISNAGRGRMGTGFLVRGGALIPALGNELIVVTNAHVISDPPGGPYQSVAYGASTITFEAVDKATAYGFAGVIWQSSVPELDCTLLRLKKQPAGIDPLEITTDMPSIPTGPNDVKSRVCVIGYPGGRGLAISFQDNELLDHEAPPTGKPPQPERRRVQYRTPTEPGSSGSPVFAEQWEVIALHHAGNDAMFRLNGVAGAWPANEGIWIQSIVAAATAQGVTS